MREPTTVGTGDPLADPFLSQASQYAMMLMGAPPDPTLATQGGPFSVAMSRLFNQIPLERQVITNMFQNIGELTRAIQAGEEPELDDARRIQIEMLAGAVGMTPEELINAQREFTVQQQDVLGRAQEMAGMTRQAQQDIAQRYAGLLRDMPDVSATGIEELKGLERSRILREINTAADEASLGAMRQANFANYNPGRVLGDIEEQRLRGTQDADLAALQYAINSLTGQTNLAMGAGSALQGYLTYPSQLASNLSGIRASAAGGQPTSVAPTYGPPNPMGMGIAQAGTQLGDAALILGDIYRNRGAVSSDLDKLIASNPALFGSGSSPGTS
jgi:hypothetical protein